jgi:HlyD family secretion protein
MIEVKMKKILVYAIGIILTLTALFLVFQSKNEEDNAFKLVTVKRGSITEKALAIGTIEPDNEIEIKSSIPGIVSDVFFKVGHSVEKGEPLFKLAPNPTPLDFAEARRNMELAEVTMKQLRRERDRSMALFQDQLIARSEMDVVESHYQEVELKYKIAREKFELLADGRIKLSNKHIDSIIKSSIDGIVLSQSAYVGDPVVPLTDFQPGTELCSIADMSKMLFKGTVDEIDVGKLKIGMMVEMNIGALPGTKVEGKLQWISPRASKDGNATVFDIEAAIMEETSKKMLRAGYSANAYVKIREKHDVLVIPERLLIFQQGKCFVEIKEGDAIRQVEIETGLSDSIDIEVVNGLKEGQQVVERPPREII